MRIILSILLLSVCYPQDLHIEFSLLNTGQLTLSSWDNVSDLWHLDVDNTSSNTINYYLAFTFKRNSENVVVGTTYPLSIESLTNITYSNLDPFLNSDALVEYGEDYNFISNIESQGYLPPGDYTLNIEAFDLQDNLLSYDQKQIEFIVGENFSIEYPNDGQVFAGGGDFYFQWDTPGFRQGVNIEFRIIIAAIISDEVDSPEDAIEIGSNSVFYFDSEWSELPIAGEWPYIETGYSALLNIWNSDLIYQTNMEPLQCGFDYAWRMDAREVIDGFGTGSDDQGLWGWPEPVHSVVRKFTWGENPTGLISPVGNDVLPLFMWDNIGCAEDGFDIQISPIEDEDFAESWDADFISSPFQFPSDVPGLIPGKSYKWRVRVHSLTGNTNWSEIETFTIQDIELIEPKIGKIVESVRPYFNIDAPANISHYELLIGDENDEYVEQVEVYNREVEITALPWQYPSQNMENGLFPNMVYYWKLLMFDGSGNILGDIEDYEVMGNFRVMPIILTEPSHGGTNIPLNPKFIWDGPLSVPSYEFWLSDDQDPEVEDPKFKIGRAHV